MAKKAKRRTKTAGRRAATQPAAAKKRRRRSPEEMIADLQEEIERVKTRARAKELKESPAVKASVTAIRAIDRGLSAAAEEGNTALRHALADARRALGEHLAGLGMKLPKVAMPKGPRPK